MAIATFTGKDGTPLTLLSDSDFNRAVNDYLKTIPREQWPRYLRKDNQKMFKMTGIGYFPNGLTNQDGHIFIRYKYRGDAELIAHEYGHVLGYDHKEGPYMMNAVAQMRMFDPHSLIERTKANFPDYWQKHVIPREAYHNTLIGAAAVASVWAWLT